MSERATGSFLSRVRASLHRMHPAERRLADFVLDFPGELASYSASELARLANVSNATVSRFVQHLGYAGYDEARRRVRAEKDDGAVLYLGARAPQAGDEFLARMLEQSHANIARTFAQISMAEIDALVKAMLGARRVWIVGFRAAHAFATYLRWQTLQVIENITLLPAAGETLAESLAGITPQDCVVVFALRRQPAQLDAVMAELVRSGATVAHVTDETVERRSDVAWHLRCHTASVGPLFDHGAVQAVCHLVATRVIEASGRAGRARLSAIEQIHDALSELRDPS